VQILNGYIGCIFGFNKYELYNNSIPEFQLQKYLLWSQTPATHQNWKGSFHGGPFPYNPSVVVKHPGITDQFGVNTRGVTQCTAKKHKIL